MHPFLTDVIVIFSRVLRPIHEVPRSGELDQLILVSKVLLVTKDFYDISSFLLYCSALQTSLARVQGFLLMVTTHNFIALKANGITEDIFTKFRVPARSLPCILPSSTSLDLIPSYMDLFHLLQILLHRSSLKTCISRFHHCEQLFFSSI